MDSKARPKIEVVMFGPGPATKGGVSRFAEIVRTGSGPDVNVRLVPTHADGSVRRLVCFARALIVSALMPRSPTTLAHVNVASRGSTLRKYLITRLLALRKIPLVLHIHGGRYETFYQALSDPLAARVRQMFDGAAAVIVLGANSADFARRALSVSSKRLFVVPNGVPGPDAVPDRGGAERLRVLFAGELSEAKGLRELMTAARAAREQVDFSLELAGKGDQTLSRSRGGAAVEGFINRHGWLEPRRLAQLLDESDVFVLPSHDEGLPLALLEAMAHGCSVIATPVGEIPEVIVQGVNGILVDPGDADGLADALVEVLTDEDLRVRLGSHARDTWSSEFSAGAMIERLEYVWREALGA